MGLYYRIWVDCIIKAKSQPANKYNWIVGCLLAMSFAMTFNLLLIMIVIQEYLFGTFFYYLEFKNLDPKLSHLLTFILLFFLPCIFINYLMIIRNKKYEALLSKYSDYKGRLFLSYFLVSVFLPIVLMWIQYFKSSK